MSSKFYAHYDSIENKRAALYVRCSKEEQAKFGDTIEAQLSDLQDFAKAHTLAVFDTYIDEGFTARKKFNKRAEFMRMMEDVQQERFDIIVFTKLDRWFRNISDYYKIQEILEAHKVNWLTALERYEIETTNGRLNVNIRLSVAQDEADRDSDRIKDVFRLKVKKGEALTGRMPIGLCLSKDKKVVIDPETTQIALDLFDHFELYNSKRGAMVYLNEKYNRCICYGTVARMLVNPLYKGSYRGNSTYCPATIEPARFDNIQKMTVRNIKKRQTNRYYVFTGLAVCKECGHNLIANTSVVKKYNREYTYYRCNRFASSRACTHSSSISEIKLESYMLKLIKPELEKYIASCEILHKAPRPKADPSKVKAKMKRLKDLYVNELIEIEEYRPAYEGYKKELDALTAAAEPPEKDLAPLKEFLKMNLSAVYDTLTAQERRMLWSSIIDKIVIDNDNNIDIIFF